MRELSNELKAHLKTGVTTLCQCWKIQRKDNVILGFTDHDSQISFDDTDFEASTGLDATALQTASGLSVDNTEASGALTSDRITQDDIASGLYDDAELYIWSVNWQDVSQRYMIFRGFIGEITYGNNSFTAELRGLTDKLNRVVSRSYIKQCSARLGDGSCGVDLTSSAFEYHVSLKRAQERRILYFSRIENVPDGWFLNGTLRFIDGKNKNRAVQILHDTTFNSERKIILAEELYYSPDQGDKIILHAGCDKQLSSCRDKFNNLINFQGFPFIPGEDWSLIYPKPSDDVS